MYVSKVLVGLAIVVKEFIDGQTASCQACLPETSMILQAWSFSMTDGPGPKVARDW